MFVPRIHMLDSGFFRISSVTTVFVGGINVYRLLMESCHKLAISWRLILVINVSVRGIFH